MHGEGSEVVSRCAIKSQVDSGHVMHRIYKSVFEYSLTISSMIYTECENAEVIERVLLGLDGWDLAVVLIYR